MYPQAQNQRDSILPFVALSVLLHLLFLIIYPLLPSTLPVPEMLKKKEQQEEKRPIYVKILDMPKPKKEEAPPKNAHIISQFNTRKKGPKGKQRPSFMSGNAPVLNPKPGPPLPIPGTLGHPGSKPSNVQPPPISPPSMEHAQKGQVNKNKGSKGAKAAPPSRAKSARKRERAIPSKEKARRTKQKKSMAKGKSEKRPKKTVNKESKNPQESQVVVKREPSVRPVPSTPPVPKRKIPLFDPHLISKYAKQLNPQMDNSGESVTLELDTKKSKYISYFRHIREKLYLVWNYPTEARMRGIQGVLRLLFVIDRSGHLTEVKLLTSSGYTILDNEAMRAIRAAAPFGPFPSDWREKELRIKARFIYHLYNGGFQ